MKKQVAITARPKQKQNADAWVEKRSSQPESKPRLKPKRLTIDIDPSLHTDLKISCAKRGIQIADLLRTLIERDVRSQESAEFRV